MELETPDTGKSANGLSSSMDDAPWTSFAVAQGAPSSPLLILCDHATNLLPPSYGTLGLPAADLKRHIGYDIGALDVSLQLGRVLHSTVIWSRFSRLLIDPNRDEGDPTLIMQISDGSIIPGNAGITDEEVQKRLALYHRPYHDRVTAELDAMIERGLIPIVVAIHSFTDVWKGVPRPWEAGVLWDADPRLAFPMLRE